MSLNEFKHRPELDVPPEPQIGLDFEGMRPVCAHAPVYRINPKHPFAEKTAYQMGFRVSEDGQMLRNGEPVHMVPNSSGYPGFSPRLPTGRRFISAHRLQAFQKFGLRIFEVGIEVRHLDGNVKNAGASNIAIGSHSDNMMDRPKWVRQRLAGNANRKHDAAKVRAFYASCRSYKRTMAAFNITSKGTLNYIVRGLEKEAL